MTVADYLVNTLIEYGVTDVFGIPGGVVLDVLYAFDKQSEKITPHLSYHEQAAAFAAMGYAQTEGTIGVAYATRGPGFTNLITGIADAYQESIPVLFITAHREKDTSPTLRMIADQEMDTIPIVGSITKYAARINTVDEAIAAIDRACKAAISGRKGPVFLDFLSSLWNSSVEKSEKKPSCADVERSNMDFSVLYSCLERAQRPVILIGEGVRQSKTASEIRKLAETHNIPILSSRSTQDLVADSDMYFGYIGSHATRYSNFILSKADLILSFGNRMAFPINSKSFCPIVENAISFRFDIDEEELKREIPNSISYNMDLKILFERLNSDQIKNFDIEWKNVCREIKKNLNAYDVTLPVSAIAEIMVGQTADAVFVCDVGNHEFWVSRAYAYSGVSNQIMYSHSFGTLGNALPKAIGAYYRSKAPIICFIGDQGLQMNIQELQVITNNSLPIMIVLINNQSSGMIKSLEERRFNGQCVHTTLKSGYTLPDFEKIVQAYGCEYRAEHIEQLLKTGNKIWDGKRPLFMELSVSAKFDMEPYLPKGQPCQDLFPIMDRETYMYLNEM